MCRLAGVPPEGHSWSRQASLALRDLVGEGELVSLRVLGHATDGCPEVELHLLDESHGSINFDLSTEFDIFPPCPASLENSLSSPTSPEPPAQASSSPEPQTLASSSPEPQALASSSPVPQASGPSHLVPLPPASLPAPGCLLQLKVTHAVSPDSFVVRLCGQQLDLAEKMEEWYVASDSEFDKPLASGETFYALHSGGQWRRVEVTQMVEDQAVVRFVDEGGQAVVGVGELRTLEEQFRSLPSQVSQTTFERSLLCCRLCQRAWPASGQPTGTGALRTTSGSTRGCLGGSWRVWCTALGRGWCWS